MNMILLTLLLSINPAVESDYWTVEHFTNPEGQILEIGGMDFLPDGRLVVSTRRGQIWTIENALADDPAEAVFRLAAEGLHEGLGLKVVGEDVLLVQRGELSRLRDLDRDGEFETIDTITQDWGMTGNYHEFAFGLPEDAEGNVYVSLNVGFWDPEWWHGRSRAPWRGWVLQIAPDGTVTPFASGLRSPCGLGIDSEGRLLATDNQGDWMAACPIVHVREGGFYGHPASLQWTDDYTDGRVPSTTIPPGRTPDPPAIWIPYAWSRSTGNLEPDVTDGAFGPFEDQLLVAELTNGMLLRAQLEEVDGITQGACFKFMQRLGSACRVTFAPDGSLIVGFTNRGWGGYPPGHGIARVRFNGVEPMEIDRVSIQPDGFDLEFTKPLDAEVSPDSLTMTAYDYNWWWDYGSPEQNVHDIPVTSTSLSPDKRTLKVTAPIEAGWCIRMRLDDIVAEDGTPLLHDEFGYTINRVPGAGPPSKAVAREVRPPDGRDDRESGWLRLTWGSVFEQWNSDGWKLGEAELDPEDRTRFTTREGNSAVVNAQPMSSDFVSRGRFGDMHMRLKFMLPEGSTTGVRILDGPTIELGDNSHLPGYPSTSGALILGDGTRIEPATNAYQGAGMWHELHAVVRVPRFDANGNLVEEAVVESISIDGTALHANVPLGPVDATRSPIAIIGSRGPVGIADIRVKPLDEAWPAGDGWTSLQPEGDLAPWTSDSSAWSSADGVLRCDGTGAITIERLLPADVSVRASLRINEGGRAELSLGDQIVSINNSSNAHPRTGSIDDAVVRTELLAPENRFVLRIDRAIEGDLLRITAHVNNVLVNEWSSPREDIGDDSHVLRLKSVEYGTKVELDGIQWRPIEP